MKEPRQPQKSAQLELAIKPVRVPVAESNANSEAARCPRLVVATFY